MQQSNRKQYLECMSREAAQEIWQQQLLAAGWLENRPTEEVSVDDALGRVTAVSLYAAQSVPHYNGAAMDGIAVRSADTYGASEREPVRLHLVDKDQHISQGCCAIVDTGDLLPAGADAIIMIEDVHVADGTAEVMSAAAPWQHVRIIGEDIVVHELVLAAGQIVEASHIGALVAAGLETVPVTAAPRVTVIPTGSELVATAQELQPGLILDVNSRMLSAAIRSWGGEVQRHEIVPDNLDRLQQAVADSLAGSDMVIINAGTSAGTEDFTSRVLASLGQVLVHGVAIKPGKPVVLALCSGKPVIGLPGYPVSAMLTAELFVRDCLLVRQNRPLPPPVMVEAVATRQLASQIGMEEYVRVSLGQVRGKTVAAPLARGAGLITTLTKAQGILSIPPSQDGLAAGTTATVRLFGTRSNNNWLSVGSHDLSLEVLGIHLQHRTGRTLTCANVGSMGGIMAVRNSECHLAGIHILDEKTGDYNISAVKKYLRPGSYQLMHLARREQGLIVAPGNPRNLQSIADLCGSGVRFVNRQRGAGTRMLLDYRLQSAGLDYHSMVGYEKEVGTHMAVAASVAAGVADAGLGIRAAAVALGLEFIPIGYEQYDLLLNLDSKEELNLLGDILRSSAFRQEVEKLGGYDLTDAGEVITPGNE